MNNKINTSLLAVLVVITLIITVRVYKGGEGRFMLNPDKREVFDTQTGTLYYYYIDVEGGWYSIDFINRNWVKHSWLKPEESTRIPKTSIADSSSLPSYFKPKSMQWR